jgi:transposase InsO family protein
MSSEDDLPERDRWARLRWGIVGALVQSPPKPGELQAAIEALANRHWRHPFTGLDVQFGFSTIERWFYDCRKVTDPLAVLRNQVRKDIGSFPSFSLEAAGTLRTQYTAHPSWNAQLHHDNLRVALSEEGELQDCPSYPSVRRYLRAHGLTRKRIKRGMELLEPERIVSHEVRSYEVEYVMQLMHLDFHHGKRKVATRSGELITPLLVAFIDDRSRFIGHAQWYTSEATEHLVHGLSQALQKIGLPRSLMSDRGSAMMSEEFTTGLARLGIVHVPTLPRSPHVNGKQENFWTRVESRLMPMLEGEEHLTLELLNNATLAWITQEYHPTKHGEIDCSPLDRFVAGPSVARECPGSDTLRDVFRIEVKRRQRRSDGTVTLHNKRLEIPSRYNHLTDVHLRYARWDLSRVDLIDPRSGEILCSLHPQDKVANAEGLRRPVEPATNDPSPAPAGIAPLLKKMMAEYAATGLPPAYLPEEDPT